jgi:hypothetical protein
LYNGGRAPVAGRAGKPEQKILSGPGAIGLFFKFSFK